MPWPWVMMDGNRPAGPSARRQVMLMIDNSSSMGAAGPLALSALATISSALTRLEVSAGKCQPTI